MNRYRSAYTLLETVLAGTVSVVVLVTTAVTFGLLLRHQDDRELPRQQWNRVADQLRRDLHASERLEVRDIQDKPFEFRLDLADGRVATYQQQSASLRRTVEQPGQSTASREEYWLPAGSTLSWPRIPAAVGQLGTFTVRYPLSEEFPGKYREVPISAILGRDLRWKVKP